MEGSMDGRWKDDGGIDRGTGGGIDRRMIEGQIEE
jgi:hypothetical protein